MHGIFFKPPIDQNFLGHQMSEIYRDGIYLPFVQGKKDLVIVDVGANIGVTSYYFSQFAKQVYSLEPAFEHFEVFTKMLQFNEIKNVKPIKKALALKNKPVTMYHNVNKTMYSLHQSVNDQSSEPEQVEGITIDKLFEDEKIEECDLLKLDIEGTETEIVSSSGFRKVAPKIKNIILETHQWSGRHPNQVADALKMNGFQVGRMASDANIVVGKR